MIAVQQVLEQMGDSHTSTVLTKYATDGEGGYYAKYGQRCSNYYALLGVRYDRRYDGQYRRGCILAG